MLRSLTHYQRYLVSRTRYSAPLLKSKTNLLRCLRAPHQNAQAKRSYSADQSQPPVHADLTSYFQQFPSSLWNEDLRRIVLSDEKASSPCLLVPMQSRALMELRGPDTLKLLQNITTRDMHSPFEGEIKEDLITEAASTCALNVKGRVVIDSLVSRKAKNDEMCILVECDRALLDNAVKHFKRYKLRSKVKISTEGATITAIFHVVPRMDPAIGAPDMAAADQWLRQLLQNEMFSQKYEAQCFADPRLSTFGYRLYITAKSKPENAENAREAIVEDVRAVVENNNTQMASDQRAYEHWRMINGIAEGAVDVPTENALPLEINLDHLDGVHFDKGCYVGQELTARTHFRGQVRKRVMPVLVENGTDDAVLPPPDVKLNRVSDLSPADKTAEEPEDAEAERMKARRLKRGVGKMCSSSGQIGLALVNLSERHEKLAYQSDPDNSEDRTLLRVVVPYWMGGMKDTPDDGE